MLARAGWSVRVHERSPQIREAGAGIYMRRNSLEILEEYGVMDRLRPHGTHVTSMETREGDGRLRQEFPLTGPGTTWVFPRQALVDALADAARAAGVQVTTGSEVRGIEEAGALVLEGGKRVPADLVVVADGYKSRLRDSLGLGARSWELKTSVNRHFLPDRTLTPGTKSVQYWSGQRRIGVAPCGAQTYVYSNFPGHLKRTAALPLDLDDWGAAFPGIRKELELIAAAPVTQYPYVMVDCPRWQKGKAAVIGDAAHGLPPTLGQGAGLAIMNARALTRALDRRSTVPAALQFWEADVRFISDLTQKWSARYDRFTRDWPQALGFMRPAFFWGFRHIKPLNERMRIADRGLALTSLGA
jgi:2-polyprenyl-6-methoxyphenol hydroxylase-like FAD-dependent oxidoreductase